MRSPALQMTGPASQPSRQPFSHRPRKVSHDVIADASVRLCTSNDRAPAHTSQMSGSDHEIVSLATFLEYRARRLHAAVTRPDTPPDVTTPTDEELRRLASAAVTVAPQVLV